MSIDRSRVQEAIDDMKYFISLWEPEIFQKNEEFNYKVSFFDEYKSTMSNIKWMSISLSDDNMYFFTPEGIFVYYKIVHPRKFCFWDYEAAKSIGELNPSSKEELWENFMNNIKDDDFNIGYSIVIGNLSTDLHRFGVKYTNSLENRLEIKSGYCKRNENNNRIGRPFWDSNEESQIKDPNKIFLYTVCHTQYLLDKRPY